MKFLAHTISLTFMIAGCSTSSISVSNETRHLRECPLESAEILLVMTLDKHQYGTEEWTIPLSRSDEFRDYSPAGLAMGHGHGTTKQGEWFFTTSQILFNGSDTEEITLDIWCHTDIDDVEVQSFEGTVKIPAHSESHTKLNAGVDLRSRFVNPS
jgi:hypothetical protein